MKHVSLIVSSLLLLTTLVDAKKSSERLTVLPERLTQLVVQTTPEEHGATINALVCTLRDLHAAEPSPLLDKQLTRFERIDTALKKSTKKVAKPNVKLQLFLSKMLEHERTVCTTEADKMWSDFESLCQELHQGVSVQNFIIDLIINMVIISGESYAQSLFSQQDQQEQAALTNQIKIVQQNYQAAQANIAFQAQQLVSNLSQNFTAAQKQIVQAQGTATAQLGQEMTYISRLIGVYTPASESVVEPIGFDLLFGASTMHTPANGYIWRNIYQNADWQFDPQLGGFIQRGATGSQPGYIRQSLCSQWQSSNGGSGPACVAYPGAKSLSNNPLTIASSQGAQNYIATEYYTNQPAYEIQVQVTLINCVFPFFAGVMFNLARWISGAFDRMYTHRLVGLYGTQDAQGKTSVALWGGQTSLSNVGGITAPFQPLNVIVGDVKSTAPAQTEQLYTLSDSDVQGLSQDPLAFVITVSNSASDVGVSLNKLVAGTSTNLYGPSSLTKLDQSQNQLMYWYHGIGFMSPGCQALFKIIEPKALAYSSQQIAAFTAAKGKKQS